MKLSTTLVALSLLSVGIALAQDAKPEAPKSDAPKTDEKKPAAEPPKTDAKATSDAAIDQIKKFIVESGAKIDKSKPDWKSHLPKPPKLTFDAKNDYFWNITTNFGEIKARFYPDAAPMHVSNAIYLTQVGFYDGLLFHRVIPGFMAQGGDPDGRGTGGPGYTIDLEVNPKFLHTKRGILSMARKPDPNSAGSQFFITFGATKSLDNGYSVFGEVVDGIKVLDELEKRGSASGATSEKLQITKATISVAPKAEAEPAAPATKKD